MSFKCETCGKFFQTERGKKTHEGMKHPQAVEEVKKKAEEIVVNVKVEGDWEKVEKVVDARVLEQKQVEMLTSTEKPKRPGFFSRVFRRGKA